jgi:hypothetical protein
MIEEATALVRADPANAEDGCTVNAVIINDSHTTATFLIPVSKFQAKSSCLYSSYFRVADKDCRLLVYPAGKETKGVLIFTYCEVEGKYRGA